MVNLEKVYRNVALHIIAKCHGGIKITKHGKILQMYDPQRHVWSRSIVGLLIKEECVNANLRDWEIANVRNYIIKELLTNSKKAILVLMIKNLLHTSRFSLLTCPILEHKK